jgi:hypothetical protein
MCRNIHTLYNLAPPTSAEEVRAAAVQYVRKISGFSKPSQANEVAFARAVDAVTEASQRLLDELVTAAPARGPRAARGARTCPCGRAARRSRLTRRSAARSRRCCSSSWRCSSAA